MLASATDGNGITTAYEYASAVNKVTGQPSAITDANGTVTSYTMDSLRRISNIQIANKAEIDYNYSNGMLSSISRRDANGGSQSYWLTYDAFGNALGTGVGAQGQSGAVTLMSYTYGAKDGLLLSQTYGNGDVVSFTYDILGRVKTTTYDDGRVLTYTYTGDGQIYTIYDSLTGFTYRYSYDVLGRVIASTLLDGTNILLQTRQTYNGNGQLSSQTFRIGDTSYTEIYTYHAQDGTLTGLTAGNGDTLTVVYDKLKRIQRLDVPGLDRNYTYRDISSTRTTSQVTKLWYGSAESSAPYAYGYTYDALGNILTYTENGVTYTYSYDDQSQLLSATGNGKTYTYSYDNAGNILAVSDGTASHTYTYGNAVWKDLLTAYDGHTITYDASGNPLSYYNGNAWSFTWTEGRKLATASGNGHSISYTYDLNGLRTSKTVDNTQYHYIYNDGELLRQTGGGKTLDFIYDNDGAPYALIYRNGSAAAETYYYITNLQGDVMQLVDEDGNTAAQYSYDPYGNILSATGDMAEINPLRYRGYYYDSESGLYYLQSRYYDPAVGRFVNADSTDYLGVNDSIISYNLFAYCENNPVNQVDTFGYFSIEAILIAGIAGGIWNVAKYVARSFWRFSWRKAIGKFVGGFLTGSIIASLAQLPKSVACGVLGAVFEVVYYVGSTLSSKRKLSASKILNRALVGYSLGLYSNAVRLVAPKLGLKYDDIATDNLNTKSILYVLAKAALDGYLTDFFSW